MCCPNPQQLACCPDWTRFGGRSRPEQALPPDRTGKASERMKKALQNVPSQKSCQCGTRQGFGKFRSPMKPGWFSSCAGWGLMVFVVCAVGPGWCSAGDAGGCNGVVSPSRSAWTEGNFSAPGACGEDGLLMCCLQGFSENGLTNQLHRQATSCPTTMGMGVV